MPPLRPWNPSLQNNLRKCEDVFEKIEKSNCDILLLCRLNSTQNRVDNYLRHVFPDLPPHPPGGRGSGLGDSTLFAKKPRRLLSPTGEFFAKKISIKKLLTKLRQTGHHLGGGGAAERVRPGQPRQRRHPSGGRRGRVRRAKLDGGPGPRAKGGSGQVLLFTWKKDILPFSLIKNSFSIGTPDNSSAATFERSWRRTCPARRIWTRTDSMGRAKQQRRPLHQCVRRARLQHLVRH